MTTATHTAATPPVAVRGLHGIQPWTRDDWAEHARFIVDVMASAVTNARRDAIAANISHAYGPDIAYYAMLDAGVDADIAHCIRCRLLDDEHAAALELAGQ